VVDCTAELGSGVGALRSTLSIPVVGPGRASCLYALMLGNKFGILASNEDGCFQHRNWVEQRGLSRFLASVEPTNIQTDVSALNAGREEEVFPMLQEAAERAISKGAEVIILGSTTMHEAGEWLSERLPVPVVNPGPLRCSQALPTSCQPSSSAPPAPYRGAALPDASLTCSATLWFLELGSYAMAEAVLQLRHSHSRLSHPSPTVPKRGMITAMLNAAAAWEKADSV